MGAILISYYLENMQFYRWLISKKKKEERKKGLHKLFKTLLVGCYWGSLEKNRKGMALEEMARHCGNKVWKKAEFVYVIIIETH